MSELIILIEGRLAGRVLADKSGRLSLEYEQEWRESSLGHSLSVALPLSRPSHSHAAVWPYLWNLLPEDPNVLQRWGQQYHVSAGNPFKLLMHVGSDVPGAAQFVSPERLAELRSERSAAIEWFTLGELGERLRQLREDISAVRRPGDIGKMSLPGAQAKTAFYWDRTRNRWGIPWGRTPTTHIVKPCIPGFDGLVENEHLCLTIAARLGLPAAKSFVLTLDSPYIVIERYDRLPPAPGSPFPRRVHQEDVCQALSLMPTKKYQEDGGPGIAQIATLIRRVSSDPEADVERFLKANMLNWLIGGTDGHAKNYSVLIDARDEMRLAPLYDISSQLPYSDLVAQRVSMRIGDHYEIARVSAADWRKLARACAFDEERVMSLLTQMADALPDEISGARARSLAEGLSSRIVTPLARRLAEHARERLSFLKRMTAHPRARAASASPQRNP